MLQRLRDVIFRWKSSPSPSFQFDQLAVDLRWRKRSSQKKTVVQFATVQWCFCVVFSACGQLLTIYFHMKKIVMICRTIHIHFMSKHLGNTFKCPECFCNEDIKLFFRTFCLVSLVWEGFHRPKTIAMPETFSIIANTRLPIRLASAPRLSTDMGGRGGNAWALTGPTERPGKSISTCCCLLQCRMRSPGWEGGILWTQCFSYWHTTAMAQIPKPLLRHRARKTDMKLWTFSQMSAKEIKKCRLTKCWANVEWNVGEIKKCRLTKSRNVG